MAIPVTRVGDLLTMTVGAGWPLPIVALRRLLWWWSLSPARLRAYSAHDDWAGGKKGSLCGGAGRQAPLTCAPLCYSLPHLPCLPCKASPYLIARLPHAMRLTGMACLPT